MANCQTIPNHFTSSQLVGNSLANTIKERYPKRKYQSHVDLNWPLHPSLQTSCTFGKHLCFFKWHVCNMKTCCTNEVDILHCVIWHIVMDLFQHSKPIFWSLTWSSLPITNLNRNGYLKVVLVNFLNFILHCHCIVFEKFNTWNNHPLGKVSISSWNYTFCHLAKKFCNTNPSNNDFK
jgi:hypothetical protein